MQEGEEGQAMTRSKVKSPSVNTAEQRQIRNLSRLGVSDFETAQSCKTRQTQMLKRQTRWKTDLDSTDGLMDCEINHCGGRICTEGCHFATRARRLREIESGVSLLQSHPGPILHATVVHPHMERPIGKLAGISLPKIRAWVARRLDQIGMDGVIAMGSFEASVNRELDGEVFWAGEVQLVVAGLSKNELSAALAISEKHRVLRPGQRCVHIQNVNNQGRQLGYALKRYVVERRAYLSGGRQSRRHLPPKPAHLVEWDTWLLGQPVGGRVITYGCRHENQTFLPGNGRS
jgi:hypothetical protein